jgi:integrase/recombinase XerD
VQRVKNFAAFLGRSPDTASFEDVRRYQLHLAASGAGVPTINQSVSTLRFFFKITLGRADIVNHTQFIHVPRKLPVVLSPEEVARFLDAAPGLKYKVALSVAYGAGLRVSEVVALKVFDIDSKRMVIRIEQGKGHKDRYVMLSPHLLELLCAWYKMARAQGWLFPGMNPVNPMTARQLRRGLQSRGPKRGFFALISLWHQPWFGALKQPRRSRRSDYVAQYTPCPFAVYVLPLPVWTQDSLRGVSSRRRGWTLISGKPSWAE